MLKQKLMNLDQLIEKSRDCDRIVFWDFLARSGNGIDNGVAQGFGCRGGYGFEFNLELENNDEGNEGVGES